MKIFIERRIKMSEKTKSKNKKNAGDNQWTNTHQKSNPDKRERHDGPGGN